MKRAGLFALLLALPVFAYANGWNSGIGDLCKGDEGAFVTVGGYVLPCSDGEDGQVLATDGSGIVSWANGSGGGNVTGSVVKVDGTALSTANFVDSSDINATASGSSVTLALTTTASNNIAKGVTAYGWGNHSAAGYLTDAPIDGTQYARKDGNWTTVSVVSVETDPVYANSTAHGIGAGNITRWDSALQNETDTLASVTARGNSTTSAIYVNGLQSSYGVMAYGSPATFPTGYGNYFAAYTSPTYGVRALAYDGATYYPLTIGSLYQGNFSLVLGNTGISYFSGNLGVGTTAPTSTLHVNGTATITTINATSVTATNLRVGTATTSGYVLTADSGGNATWQAASGGGSSQWTNGTAGIYYSAGNVAIGTTATTNALNVNGTIRTTDIVYGEPKPCSFVLPYPVSRCAAGSIIPISISGSRNFTLSGLKVRLFKDPASELNANLYFADDDNAYGNPYLICALDTTNGMANITSFTNAVIPAGKQIFIVCDEVPDSSIENLEVSSDGAYQ